jgi:hypothetical protein
MNHLQQIAQSYQDYTTAYNAGQLNAAEYKSLLEGLEVEKALSLNAEELQYKEQLNMAINAAISTVSMIA